MKKVSIIVLNWNNYQDTKECLESLQKITYPHYEVIIVDNGSKDGSTKRLQKEFPQYIYIYNKENLGCAGGFNVGMKHALERGADYLFPLNNDMIVEESFLEPLLAAMEEKVGIVGSAIYSYPQTEILHTAGEKINFWKGGLRQLYLTEKEEVDCLDGCFLIRKELIDKIGYFNQAYFLYREETEYCLLARKAGFKVICQPKSRIWHKVGTSVDKTPPSTAFYSYQGKFLFMKRNAPFYLKYPFCIYGSLYLIFRALENLIKGDKSMALAIRDVLIDFWKR